MPEKLFKLYDDLVIWNTLEDALEAKMRFECLRCGKGVSVSIHSDSEGSLFTSPNETISKHLETLADQYHATARSIVTQCPKGHMLRAVFIFGETQPMRYVLARVASISPQPSSKEKLAISFTLIAVFATFLGVNYVAFNQFVREQTLRKSGRETSALIVDKSTHSIPRSPTTYNIHYMYMTNSVKHSANAQVNSNTFNSAQVGDSIPIVVSNFDSSVSQVLSNSRYKTILYGVLVLDLVVLVVLVVLIANSKTTKLKRTV